MSDDKDNEVPGCLFVIAVIIAVASLIIVSKLNDIINALRG